MIHSLEVYITLELKKKEKEKKEREKKMLCLGRESNPGPLDFKANTFTFSHIDFLNMAVVRDVWFLAY